MNQELLMILLAVNGKRWIRPGQVFNVMRSKRRTPTFLNMHARERRAEHAIILNVGGSNFMQCKHACCHCDKWRSIEM